MSEEEKNNMDLLDWWLSQPQLTLRSSTDGWSVLDKCKDGKVVSSAGTKREAVVEAKKVMANR